MSTIKTIKSFGERVWGIIAPAHGTQANQNEISFFDVKALYDAAYEEKAKARANIGRFRTLIGQAEWLEAAYRAQLLAARPSSYLGKAA